MRSGHRMSGIPGRFALRELQPRNSRKQPRTDIDFLREIPWLFPRYPWFAFVVLRVTMMPAPEQATDSIGVGSLEEKRQGWREGDEDLLRRFEEWKAGRTEE